VVEAESLGNKKEQDMQDRVQSELLNGKVVELYLLLHQEITQLSLIEKKKDLLLRVH